MKAASGRRRASPPSIRVAGHIDGIDPSGVVSGWCAEADPPFTERRVSVLVDGVAAARGVACTMFRRDLLEAGVGDGNHGFTAEIPSAHMVAEGEASVSLLDETTGLPVGEPVTVRWAAPPKPEPPPPLLEAHVDDATPDGMIGGWCWDRAAPERRVALNILADGVVVGTTIAAMYRDDLREAGKGSGHCGFSFMLPWPGIAGRGDVAIALQDHDTGAAIGEPRILHRPQAAQSEQRLDALEQQIEQLRREMQAAEARLARQEDDRAASALFRQLSTVFHDLAEGRAVRRHGSLRAHIDEVTSRFPPIAFGVPADPAVTLYVLPGAGIEPLHACLAALHQPADDARARVVVLGLATDPAEEAILIQAVTRNVAVLRLLPQETLNDVLLATVTPYLALVSSHMIAGSHWLAELLAALREDAMAAIASSAMADQQGRVISRRLAIDWRGYFIEAPDEDGAEVDAVDGLGVLVRLDAMRSAGGLDLSYEALPAQLLDLCLRLRLAGHRIAYRGLTLTACAEPPPSLLDQTSAADLHRLRETARRVVARHDQS